MEYTLYIHGMYWCKIKTHGAAVVYLVCMVCIDIYMLYTCYITMIYLVYARYIPVICRTLTYGRYIHSKTFLCPNLWVCPIPFMNNDIPLSKYNLLIELICIVYQCTSVLGCTAHEAADWQDGQFSRLISTGSTGRDGKQSINYAGSFSLSSCVQTVPWAIVKAQRTFLNLLPFLNLPQGPKPQSGEISRSFRGEITRENGESFSIYRHRTYCYIQDTVNSVYTQWLVYMHWYGHWQESVRAYCALHYIQFTIGLGAGWGNRNEPPGREPAHEESLGRVQGCGRGPPSHPAVVFKIYRGDRVNFRGVCGASVPGESVFGDGDTLSSRPNLPP
jgi:hypothetical protein